MTSAERIPADDVNMGEWLTAMLPVVGTDWDSLLLPTDFRVALALADTGGIPTAVVAFTGPGCYEAYWELRWKICVVCHIYVICFHHPCGVECTTG